MIGFRLSKVLTQLAYPLAIAMLLLLVALALLSRGRARAARGWLAAGIALLWIASLPAVGFHVVDFLESRHAPVAPADAESAGAIVLLGGAISPPYPPLYWMDLNDAVDRIVHAARLQRAGKAPIIVVAGGGGPYIGGPQTPADAMGELLVEWGIPREALVLERRSRNTYENALYAKELLDERGITRVLVVTSASHMLRSLAIFRSLGLDAVPAATDYSALGRIDYGNPLIWIPDAGTLRGTSAALKEYLGIAVYWARGWIEWDEIWR
ncbi:MAG: YdcF family protein [Proteobacteria bacterium]|nr:MAG: YdcF family protein [Pseudomonadota bacterium]